MPSTALYVVEFRFTGGFESYSAHHLFKHLQAFQIWIWAIWGHFSNLLDDASLRFALRLGHSLNVRVHGDTDVCMAHQCLHRRHIFTVRFEQRTERVSERMPTDPFRNPGSLRCRTDVILHCAVRPNRLLAVHLD